MKAETALPSGSEILVLEDDLRLRRRLVAHLKSHGCETAEAASLAEARRQLASSHFDFMVADINLPDGDLFEVLREGLVPDTTALVVMTAFGGVDIAVEAMRLGAGDYLAKPFEPDELILAFLRCRRERHSQRREESLRRHSAPSAQNGDLLFGSSLAPLSARLEAPPPATGGAALAHTCINPAWRLPEEGFSLDAVVSDLVAQALCETSGNVSAAARRLGVTREFLRYHLKENQKTPPAAPDMLG